MESKFDLEKALAGAKVITRDGREVTQLKFFEDVNLNLIVGVVSKNIWSWDINGQLDSPRGDNPLDLFMAKEKKSIWVNVYEGDILVLGHSRNKSFDEAKLNIHEGFTYIKTIEITNEL